MEARLGLPIGGMNKRPEEEAEEGAVAGTQIGFGQFVVGPMFETLGPSPADPQPSARLATPPRDFRLAQCLTVCCCFVCAVKAMDGPDGLMKSCIAGLEANSAKYAEIKAQAS